MSYHSNLTIEEQLEGARLHDESQAVIDRGGDPIAFYEGLTEREQRLLEAEEDAIEEARYEAGLRAELGAHLGLQYA